MSIIIPAPIPSKQNIDPRALPKWSSVESSLRISNTLTSNLQTFWDALDLFGAYTATAYVGGTPKTIVNLLDTSGVLTHIVLPISTAGGVTDALTVDVTLDGIKTSIIMPALRVYRPVLGAMVSNSNNQSLLSSQSNKYEDLYSAADYSTFNSSGTGSSIMMIEHPQNALGHGRPHVRFEKSLLVEVTMIGAGALSGTKNNTGVIYALD